MEELVQALTELGFAESDARAYIVLLQQGPLTGYEVAKVSRVPRGNIYKVLEKLELRGAALRIESRQGVQYRAVSPAEMLPRLAQAVQLRAVHAQGLLERLGRPPAAELVSNVQGHEPVLNQARGLISTACQSLVIALCREEAASLVTQMRDAAERSIAIDTLCLTGCAEECGGCQEHIERRRVAPIDGGRWLMVVPDGPDPRKMANR